MTDNIATDSELQSFNEFLLSVRVTDTASVTAEQKVCVCPSFALSGILVKPKIFETRPEPKINNLYNLNT